MHLRYLHAIFLCVSLTGCAFVFPDRPAVDLGKCQWRAAEGYNESYIQSIPADAKPAGNTPIALNALFQAEAGTGTVHYTLFCSFEAPANVPQLPALFFPGIGENWEIYLNGRLLNREMHLKEDGRIAVRRTMIGLLLPLEKNLLSPVNSLVIHIAGRRPPLRGGGASPGLFYADGYRLDPLIKIQEENSETAGIALTFMYLAFGVYHLILFVRRRKDNYNFYFFFFSASVFIYYFTRTYFIYRYVGDTSLLTRLEHMAMAALLPGFLLFLQKYFYPEARVPLWLKILTGLDAVLALASCVLPIEYLNQVNLTWNVLQLPFILFVPVYMWLAVKNRRRDSIQLSTGMVALYLCACWDLLNGIFKFHSMNTIFQYGFFTFALAHIGTLANRFAVIFNEKDDLNRELDKRNSSLLQLDRMKDRFLATTSHELRTPLHGIMGLAEFLYEDRTANFSPEASANLKMIVQSAKRLSRLVDEILDFSRLQEGVVRLDLKSINPGRTVESVITILRPLVRESIELINRVPADFPSVLADENRLEQILFNLIGNALKFTKTGFVRISAALTSGIAEIIVEDTGIGIPENSLDEIFKAFEQADESIAQRYGGAGLGLSITKQLVLLHGGTIRTESVVGQGSRFIFTLPLAKKTDPQTLHLPEEKKVPREETPVAASVREARPGPLVLAVDDEPVNLKVIENILYPAGYTVESARSAAEALVYFEKPPIPDIILLDVMMPGMTGYELCELLRQRYSMSELPVLMLTARNLTTDLVEGFRSGANDYLTKPFERMELLARVETLCRLKKATEERDALASIREELRIARRIQTSILPEMVPYVSGFKIESRYVPRGDVGGDFYDFHTNGNGDLTAIIADVTGHGIPAAMVGAMLKVAFWVEMENFISMGGFPGEGEKNQLPLSPASSIRFLSVLKSLQISALFPSMKSGPPLLRACVKYFSAVSISPEYHL